MAVYNYSNITNANTTLEQMIAVDQTLTGGYFAIFFIMSIFIILLFAFYKEGWGIAMVGSSFITTILTIFLWASGLVPLYITIMMMVIAMLSFGAVFFTNK